VNEQDPRADYHEPAPMADVGWPAGAFCANPNNRLAIVGFVGFVVGLTQLVVAVCMQVGTPSPGSPRFVASLVVAATGVLYAVAAVVLLAHAAFSRPPRGAAVVICNALIVAPVGWALTLNVVGFPVVWIVFLVVEVRAIPTVVWVSGMVMITPSIGSLVFRPRYHARRIGRAFRLWLDPTDDLWGRG